MIRPSFSLWRNILGDYVNPSRSIEFNAQLARLFTAFGHQWEPDPEPQRQVDFTEQERARHAIIRAEIQAGWSDEERRKRCDGDGLREKLEFLSRAIASADRESGRVRISKSRAEKEVCQLTIGYQD